MEVFSRTSSSINKTTTLILRDELVPISHNRCSTKTCQNILGTVKSDKVLENDYQDNRDMIILSLVKDLNHYGEQLKEIDEEIERMYNSMGCTLTTIPGVNVITAAKIVSEIGDVRRFSSASKLAQFAAIAPLKLSSKGVARNQAFRDYYEKRIGENKPPKQVLICISKRLINIICGMLKNKTEYRMPEVKSANKDLETEG